RPLTNNWKTVSRPLSLNDLDRMVSSLGTAWLDVRDKAMLLTFFASGLRESELAGLKVRDLNLEDGAAKVWDGKGGTDGIIPLSPPAIAVLKEYLENVRPQLADGLDTPYVFVGRRGKPLSRQQIYYRVPDIARAALAKHISSHFLWHAFATAIVPGRSGI